MKRNTCGGCGGLRWLFLWPSREVVVGDREVVIERNGRTLRSPPQPPHRRCAPTLGSPLVNARARAPPRSGRDALAFRSLVEPTRAGRREHKRGL